jgi:hypothetical protein
MSESEKSRRNKYRKNREKWIFAQSLIIVVLSLLVLTSSIVAYRLNKTYYIDYTEGGSIDYNVFLKENEFFEDSYLGKDQSYVASLIDRIMANFNYEMDIDDDDVNYRYSYRINSKLEIIDDTSGVAIFDPVETLVEVNNQAQNSQKRLSIKELVVLNYDEYNNLASKFIETYSLTNVTSNIVVTMEVDVLSDCNAMAGSSVDNFSSELRIPLTTKTVNIKMTSTVPEGEEKMLACTRGAGSEVFKTGAIVFGVADLFFILFLVAFIYLTRTEDITYTARVKKILTQYKSYIQRINNLFNTSGYQVILVNTFDEMLEIRDTIQAPILMHENADKTCAKFIIPTDSKLLYLFEIKIEGFSEPEPEPTPEPPAPTTLVKPNITNVVRPVVKVVVTPPSPAPVAEPEPEPEPEPEEEIEAEIETVVEEPLVEIEAEPEEAPIVVAEVEEEAPEIEEVPEIEEEIPEMEEELVEEILEEIPMVEETIVVEPAMEEALPTVVVVEDPIAEEEPGVDAIDVIWPERDHKTYRYDPDGNAVEEGDVVLVPTRDVASDKEVVREAEVARGNYKIDPATLDHPLKKIIGVVKRKAEKVFATMILPEDEDQKSEEN